MNEEFDKGDIIFNEIINIDQNETYGQLAVKMRKHIAHVVLNVAEMVQCTDRVPSTPQDENKSCYFEKPQFSDTYINWKRMSASEIIALINACNPWNNGADASFKGQYIKIINATFFDEPHLNKTPGTILSISKDSLLNVACIDNEQISIELLRMDEGIITAKKFIEINDNFIESYFN